VLGPSSVEAISSRTPMIDLCGVLDPEQLLIVHENMEQARKVVDNNARGKMK
jgi:hypothetical protein